MLLQEMQQQQQQQKNDDDTAAATVDIKIHHQLSEHYEICIASCHKCKGGEQDIVIVLGADDFWFPMTVPAAESDTHDLAATTTTTTTTTTEAATATTTTEAAAAAQAALERDECNILYVACSRARHQLHLVLLNSEIPQFALSSTTIAAAAPQQQQQQHQFRLSRFLSHPNVTRHIQAHIADGMRVIFMTPDAVAQQRHQQQQQRQQQQQQQKQRQQQQQQEREHLQRQVVIVDDMIDVAAVTLGRRKNRSTSAAAADDSAAPPSLAEILHYSGWPMSDEVAGEIGDLVAASSSNQQQQQQLPVSADGDDDVEMSAFVDGGVGMDDAMMDGTPYTISADNTTESYSISVNPAESSSTIVDGDGTDSSNVNATAAADDVVDQQLCRQRMQSLPCDTLHHGMVERLMQSWYIQNAAPGTCRLDLDDVLRLSILPFVSKANYATLSAIVASTAATAEFDIVEELTRLTRPSTRRVITDVQSRIGTICRHMSWTRQQWQQCARRLFEKQQQQEDQKQPALWWCRAYCDHMDNFRYGMEPVYGESIRRSVSHLLQWFGTDDDINQLHQQQQQQHQQEQQLIECWLWVVLVEIRYAGLCILQACDARCGWLTLAQLHRRFRSVWRALQSYANRWCRDWIIDDIIVGSSSSSSSITCRPICSSGKWLEAANGRLLIRICASDEYTAEQVDECRRYLLSSPAAVSAADIWFPMSNVRCRIVK
jgi:hypothetical protein